MKKLGLVFTIGLLLSATGSPNTSAFAGENCTCRFSGGEIAEGETACIKSPNGMTMARCERVLNNTSWKMLDTPCPYSSLPVTPEGNMSLAQLPIGKDALPISKN